MNHSRLKVVNTQDLAAATDQQLLQEIASRFQHGIIVLNTRKPNNPLESPALSWGNALTCFTAIDIIKHKILNSC